MWDPRRFIRNVSNILHSESKMIKRHSKLSKKLPVIGGIVSGATSAIGSTFDAAGSSVGQVANVSDAVFGKPPKAKMASSAEETLLKRSNKLARIIQLGSEDFSNKDNPFGN